MKPIILLLIILFTMPTYAHDHLTTVTSSHSVKDTADKFAQLVEAKGLTLFARIDHAANAKGVDLELAPTELVLFGNPNVGTKLMQCAPTVAIDLPQKALIWEDADGSVKLAYNTPAYLKEAHSIEGCDPIIEKITGLLAGLAAAATE